MSLVSHFATASMRRIRRIDQMPSCLISYCAHRASFESADRSQTPCAERDIDIAADRPRRSADLHSDDFEIAACGLARVGGQGHRSRDPTMRVDARIDARCRHSDASRARQSDRRMLGRRGIGALIRQVRLFGAPMTIRRVDARRFLRHIARRMTRRHMQRIRSCDELTTCIDVEHPDQSRRSLCAHCCRTTPSDTHPANEDVSTRTDGVYELRCAHHQSARGVSTDRNLIIVASTWRSRASRHCTRS